MQLVRGVDDRSEPHRDVQEDLTMELNHRVANSLQLLSIFLAAQERCVSDMEAKTALHTAASRIAAAGRVQRALLRGRSPTVEIGAFLRTLCADLSVSTGLTITAEADNVVVSAACAEQIAIVVNELIVNAAKHAYGEQEAGVIVTCRKNSIEKTLVLTAADKGRGLPATFDLQSKTVGMTILRAATNKLNANLEFRGAKGTVAALTIPL